MIAEALAAARAALARARPVRRALLAACALALAGALGHLYLRTQGAGLRHYSEALELLRELKEIDARWDVELQRARAALRPEAAPRTDYRPALARIERALLAAAHASASEVLVSGAPELARAFAAKAEAMERYREAAAASARALAALLGAEPEIAGLVRGAWREFPDRERLVAAESAVAQLVSEALRYRLAPAAAQRASLEALAADLAAAARPLPPPLRAALERLQAAALALAAAAPSEHELYATLSFLPAGPRVDSLAAAAARELDERLGERELYRVYLLAYAAALLVLLAYLGARLAASYRMLHAANAALRAANETLEERVAERTRELSQALEQLKQSEAQLIQSEKMSSLGQMVAGVSHEINTPAAYVKNSLVAVQQRLAQLAQLAAETRALTALLRAGASDPRRLAEQFEKTQALLARLDEEEAFDELQQLARDGLYGIEQIAELVVNLRNFARLDRSRVAAFDLNEGLESTLVIARHELKGHTVRKNFGDLPPVTCSPSQINQVFLNLITNAAQAVEPGRGVITLTTRREGDSEVAVEIEDNGKGIAPEILPKIFDPFFTTKEAGQGTGLGLAIAYRIVREHGGRIGVESTVGVGTKFTMVLPLSPPPAAPA